MEQLAFEKAIKEYIKSRDLSQAAIARKLGYTPVTLNKWIKGVNTIPADAIAQISNLLNLSDKERTELFSLAGYTAVAQLSEEAVSTTKKDPSALSNLPPKPYHKLIGRDTELNTIIKVLSSPPPPRIVAIVGLGGIGKTALAYETVEHCQQEQLFDYFVWKSIKTDYFESGHIIHQEKNALNFDELLDEIGYQCNQLEILKLPSKEKLTAVNEFLKRNRVLIILDNLETLSESEMIINNFVQILGQSKLLITSRYQITNENTYTILLRGLSEEQGFEFLKLEANARNIKALLEDDIENEILSEIHKTAAGSPLAMKLIVGQLSFQPVQVILDSLREASSEGQTLELYRFVYWHSWSLLSDTARKILIGMSVFAPGTGATTEDLEAIADVDREEFWPAMEELVRMSLVDKIGPVGRERFTLNPLTYYFVLSDVVKVLGE